MPPSGEMNSPLHVAKWPTTRRPVGLGSPPPFGGAAGRKGNHFLGIPGLALSHACPTFLLAAVARLAELLDI